MIERNRQAEQDLVAEAMQRAIKWIDDTDMRCRVIDQSGRMTHAVVAHCAISILATEIAVNTTMPPELAAEMLVQTINKARAAEEIFNQYGEADGSMAANGSVKGRS